MFNIDFLKKNLIETMNMYRNEIELMYHLYILWKHRMKLHN